MQTSTLGDTNTLKEAKEFLRTNWEEGAICPCCTQAVKLYKRTLQSSMAIMLVNLYKLTKATGEEYHHIIEMKRGYEKYISSAGDFASSRFWGLTEEGTGDKENVKRQGYWKLTQKGIDFVENNITVPSHIKVFNAKCYGFEGEEITIADALKKRFDYYELMKI